MLINEPQITAGLVLNTLPVGEVIGDNMNDVPLHVNPEVCCTFHHSSIQLLSWFIR